MFYGCTTYSLSILSADVHLGHFHYLTIMTNVILNNHDRLLCGHCLQFCWLYNYIIMEFLYHMVILCLTFWGTNCFLEWFEWVSVKVAQLCLTLWDPMDYIPHGPHGLYSQWNFPGQNTGVGSLSLLQEIFPTQGSNPALLHCRWILYQLSH